MASPKKKALVSQLIDLIKNSPHFALVKFENTPHTALEKLRIELKKNSSIFKVVKKSLFEKSINKIAQTDKALKKLQKKVLPLQDNSALLTLGEDYMSGLKTFSDFAKNEKTLSFKFGFFDKHLYPGEEVQKISQLPSRDQLIAQIIGSLKSTTTKLIYSMKFNVNKFVYILKQKGGD